MQEGLHDGHRERLINKFVDYPDSFSEHELLEVFLFTVIPRKDTNELAHRLLTAFGSIKKVFAAKPEQLTAVKGVGKSIAAQIALHAKLMQKIQSETAATQEKSYSSFDRIKREITAAFDGIKAEKFLFLLLNDAFEKVFCLEYSGNDEEEVFADTSEIARAMCVNKAKYAIMAHNHPSGNEKPSAADDLATKKCCITCELHGIKLADHIIVAGDKIYSYFGERRLDYIRESLKLEKIM